MNYFEDKLEDNALIMTPEDGDRLDINGMVLKFKVTSYNTKDQMGIYEITLPPKSIGAKLHYHRFMDETFLINQGIVTLTAGKKEYEARPGTLAYIPRFTPHAFRNDSDEVAVLTLIFNPAQKREGFFLGLFETLNEVPIDPNKYLKLYNKYDSFPVDTNQMLPIYD